MFSFDISRKNIKIKIYRQVKSYKNSKTARVFLAVLHFNNYFFNLKTKANPSPKGNGFVFTLFGDPYGKHLRFTTMAEPNRMSSIYYRNNKKKSTNKS